ncbi:MAG TPA: hypothetical protein VF778_02260, partial [Xanthobacteraceae bacterium]
MSRRKERLKCAYWQADFAAANKFRNEGLERAKRNTVAPHKKQSGSFATLGISQSENVDPLVSCCFYSCVDRHCWNLRNSSSRSSAVNLLWRGEASARCPGNWTTLSARRFAAPWLGKPGLSRCVHELTWAKA